MALNTNQDALVRIYLAAFLRPPEKSGFDYWSGLLQSGASIQEIATAIFFLPTVDAIYPSSLAADEFVSQIYRSVFGKAADAEGLSYWSDLLSIGQSRGQLVLNMINTGLALPDTTPGKYFVANRYQAALYALEKQQVSNIDLDPIELKDAMQYVSADANSLANFSNRILEKTKQTVLPNGIFYSSTELIESFTNDGSISNSLTLLLKGDVFKGELGVRLGTVTNVPVGMTAYLTKTSEVTASLTLTGKAKDHTANGSTMHLTVAFKDLDFLGGHASNLYGAYRNDIKVSFFTDTFVQESSGTIFSKGSVGAALVLNLETDTVTYNTKTIGLVGGDISLAKGMDASGAFVATTAKPSKTPTVGPISFKGDAQANSYIASPLGDTIEARGGNDTLTAGAGLDKIILEATAAANGVDVINGLQFGAGKDILQVSRFLNLTSTLHIASHADDETAEAVWINGDVLVMQGFQLDADKIAASFGAGLPFKAPTAGAKAVLITSDIVGDASVWYITNQTAVTSIEAAEVTLVATLVGVHNLMLTPLDATNFS